jgi:hypothetical protein
MFTTMTGVATHIESSGCPGRRDLNIHTIYIMIRARDRHEVITKPMNNRRDGLPRQVGEEARAGSSYKCPLCSRLFGTLKSLEQHINSVARRSYHL